ncbi:fatty aldehyde dehydrogenase [Burkholderia pseudomallei]|nr:fatty aldehyde dehydrogenase [Burkholderia pseudomallei]
MTTDLVESTAEQVDAAASASASAAESWATSSGAARSRLLRGLAKALDSERQPLVDIADRETQLGVTRLNGELDRTVFQLRAFAALVEAGVPFEQLDDPAVSGGPPAGHPRLTRIRVPIGPVAMFAASNFPFAFSVLGGDTASALAAGCPVVVKAHPGHTELSRAVFELACAVLSAQQLPAGIVQMVQGTSVDVGVRLVRHPAICAVAFTGSFKGGTALQAQVNVRQRPIPFYGELGSINPVVVLPTALQHQPEDLAQSLAASIAQGSGQFCTCPGLVIVRDNAEGAAFIAMLATSLAAAKPHAMLTPEIRRAYDSAINCITTLKDVHTLIRLPRDPEKAQPTPFLAVVDTQTFMRRHELREEIFGPACIVVKVATLDETVEVLQAIEGSLTATIWGAESATAGNLRLARVAMGIAGRVLFSGVPTGVAITAAQQHGGPWPASTQAFTTSVGHAALDRFLRPVALQDAPEWLVRL